MIGSMIASWLTDSISVAHPTSVGNDGDLAYGSAATVAARVEHGNYLAYGQKPEAQATHYIATLTAISWDDNIWLPGENPSTDEPHRIINLDWTTNKAGDVTLYEVYL